MEFGINATLSEDLVASVVCTECGEAIFHQQLELRDFRRDDSFSFDHGGYDFWLDVYDNGDDLIIGVGSPDMPKNDDLEVNDYICNDQIKDRWK